MDNDVSKSDRIRQLAAEGVSVSEIARRLGIRYQFAYGVLRRGAATGTTGTALAAPANRPHLTTETLVNAGFTHSATWSKSDTGSLVVEPRLPSAAGVYAFAKQSRILYVGVATMGLAKRIYFYGKPGVSQKTSLRINAAIIEEINGGGAIEVYTAIPPDFEWNGLPVSGVAGLELGLIRRYELPWNIRSAR